MGSCIICGTSVDGHICDIHVEDVLFEFRGEHPNQLTVNRFYDGTVDGYAEFGVFVDVGEHVTGLLHRSELDRRLDSLDWESGDDVVVKVKNVRDNGNVDLGWSIRQREAEFRGRLIDDPEFDHARLAEEVEGSDGASDDASDDRHDDAGGGGDRDDEHTGADDPSENGGSDDGAVAAVSAGTDGPASAGHDGRANDASDGRRAGSDASDGQPTETDDGSADGSGTDDASTIEAGGDGGGRVSRTDAADRSDRSTSVVGEGNAGGDDGHGGGGGSGSAGGSAAVVEETEPPRVTVTELADHLGEDIRLEGEIANVEQTSGPTVFQLADESGTVDCAAFVEAGVRAYPEVEEDDAVRLDGEVRRRHGDLQVETEALEVLAGEDADDVRDRIADALEERARPDEVEPLAEDPTVDALDDVLVDAATAIRRAVITDRPVIVRHSATADGYVAGVALERATIPLVREEHRESAAEYHYFDRRPLEGGVYDMDDATMDVTNMLENRERHGEKVPLVVFVAAGGTRESVDGFELLDVYGAPRVVVDDVDVDDEVIDAVETVVSPGIADAPATTASTLAANVAAHVNEDVREDLVHLPAVSFWDVPPADYQEAAAEAGYDDDTIRELREAVALEAYYQSYEDKRELITDLLFGDDEADVGSLAANVAEQFRAKMNDAVETATANLDHQNVDGARVAVLDTEAFTHGFDFPPTTLLLDELYRERGEDVDALVGIAKDTLSLRDGGDVDVHALAGAVAEGVPGGGVTVRSARERKLGFLAGERSAVLEATLQELSERL